MTLSYLDIVTLLTQQAPGMPMLRLLSLLLYREAAAGGRLDPSVAFVDAEACSVVMWDEASQRLRATRLGNRHKVFVSLMPLGGVKYAALRVSRAQQQYHATILDSSLHCQTESYPKVVNKFLRILCSHAAEEKSVWLYREFTTDADMELWPTPVCNAAVFALWHLRRILHGQDMHERIDDTVVRETLGQVSVDAMKPLMPRAPRLTTQDFRNAFMSYFEREVETEL
ncbi:hypothetical protein EJ03DRAFT_356460 [Teratosphaeria nubilosa]|uniref:Uncharacterized protein n=1 Tax=Teratosphaeria nubilosa TaxID=161662 RepID=A0A6G1KTI6_9PEZI|nr:hypothetical protein EJ03DRAFT_356460 [Teratosphaeria nubilosa]